MPIVQLLVACTGGLEVGRQSLAIASLEHRGQQRRADAAGLLLGLDARELQVEEGPVRVMLVQ
jgi:hypothetical protein